MARAQRRWGLFEWRRSKNCRQEDFCLAWTHRVPAELITRLVSFECFHSCCKNTAGDVFCCSAAVAELCCVFAITRQKYIFLFSTSTFDSDVPFIPLYSLEYKQHKNAYRDFSHLKYVAIMMERRDICCYIHLVERPQKAKP